MASPDPARNDIVRRHRIRELTMPNITAPTALTLLLAACTSGAPTPDTAPPPEYVVTPPPPPVTTADPHYAPPPPTTPNPPTTPPTTDPPIADASPVTVSPTTAPTDPISGVITQVPAAVAANYVLSISADRNQLTIDPRPRPASRAAVRDIGGFTTHDSANGGKVISLSGGPFRNARWVQASFRELVAPGPQQDELTRARYNLEQRRDLLVVDGEHDNAVTLFAFSADASKPGIVGICSQVTIVDFVPGNNRPIAVRKPVIYLYPKIRSEVKVQVEVAGDMIASYPKPGPDGWRVTAEPDGTLLDTSNGRRHRYLFWEATSAEWTIDPARAHSVAAEEAPSFLERACGRFALTDQECGDFITYWLPALERNGHSLVEFVAPERYARYARMRVEPTPDTTIRLFMLFRRSEPGVQVGAPELPQQSRRGFTVIEWGGADLDERPAPAR